MEKPGDDKENIQQNEKQDRPIQHWSAVNDAVDEQKPAVNRIGPNQNGPDQFAQLFPRYWILKRIMKWKLGFHGVLFVLQLHPCISKSVFKVSEFKAGSAVFS